MRVLFNRLFLEHNINSEAEGSYRLQEFTNYEDEYFDGEEYITLVHPESYRKRIRQSCMNRRYMAEIFLTPESYRAACLSVGLSVKAAQYGHFAAVRPPGHHAHRDKTAGFCLFNNIAIAVQYLVNEGKRVFIFDFDGHHGDGTQEIFYDSAAVFYCSLHQMYTWPFTGSPLETGEGEGKGYTLNFPLLSGSGDKEFLETVDKAIAAAHKFEPDVIAVSAGFDGYEKDRLLNLNFSLKSYYECGYKWRRAFNNVFAVLEGGYHKDIKKCTDAFVEGVNVGARPKRNRFDHLMSVG